MRIVGVNFASLAKLEKRYVKDMGAPMTFQYLIDKLDQLLFDDNMQDDEVLSMAPLLAELQDAGVLDLETDEDDLDEETDEETEDES